MLIDEAVETGPGNPQNLCGLPLHSAGTVQDSLDMGCLDCGQSVSLRPGTSVRRLKRLHPAEGEVLGIQHSAPAQYDGPGEGVLQFPDVAGPVVGRKAIQGFRGETSSPSVQLPADPGQQVFGEERDVPLPLSQWRYVDNGD